MTLVTVGGTAHRRRALRAADGRGCAGARVPARRARIDRPLAVVPGRRPPTRAAIPKLLVYSRARPRPQRARERATPSVTYMHDEADDVLPALLGRFGIDDADPRRAQRRRVDRPPVRRRPTRGAPAWCCSRRTSSSRTGRSKGSRRPAAATGTATWLPASPATTTIQTARSGGGTTCGSRRSSGRGTSRTGSPVSPARCSSSRATPTRTARSPNSMRIERGVSGECVRVVLPGVGHVPHLEAPAETLAAVSEFVRGIAEH